MNYNESYYLQFINQNRVKSILYSYLLFYFFKIKIKNSLYKFYKIFFNYKNRKYRYYRMPFIYEPRVYFISRKKFKMDIKRVSLQLVRLFYIIYSFKQLRRLIRRAKRSDNVFDNTFVLLMECKLPSFIYRSSLFSNMFESINFIKSQNL